MNTSVMQLEWLNIGIALLPMIPVIVLVFFWSERGWTAIYSIARMFIQLVVIGYFLVYIFATSDPCRTRGRQLLVHRCEHL